MINSMDRPVDAGNQPRIRNQSGRRARILALLPLVSLIFLNGTASADAVPSVIVKCAGCSTYAQFEAAARNYFIQNKFKTPAGFPNSNKVLPYWTSIWNTQMGEPVDTFIEKGTVAVVMSDSYPLTGTFEFYGLVDGVVNIAAVTTPTELSLKDYDAYINARSSKMPPIEMPGNISPSDDPETISQALRVAIPAVGVPVTDLWHGLSPSTWGQFTRWTVHNLQDNQTYTIYSNDTITIKYSNGWTEKWKLLSFYSERPWNRVDGSLRDENGNDPSAGADNSEPNPAEPVEYANSSSGGQSLGFLAVPISYNVPGSRIERERMGIVVVYQVVTSASGFKRVTFQD